MKSLDITFNTHPLRRYIQVATFYRVGAHRDVRLVYCMVSESIYRENLKEIFFKSSRQRITDKVEL